MLVFVFNTLTTRIKLGSHRVEFMQLIYPQGDIPQIFTRFRYNNLIVNGVVRQINKTRTEIDEDGYEIHHV